MGININKNDVFIDFEEEISAKSIDHCQKNITQASKKGCDKLIFNFKNVKSFDNMFLDFVISVKNRFASINFYNVNINLLPAFYLLKLDQIANFYTSEHDAIHEVKPIIKRRFGIVHQKILMFLTSILVLTNIA